VTEPREPIWDTSISAVEDTTVFSGVFDEHVAGSIPATRSSFIIPHKNRDNLDIYLVGIALVEMVCGKPATHFSDVQGCFLGVAVGVLALGQAVLNLLKLLNSSARRAHGAGLGAGAGVSPCRESSALKTQPRADDGQPRTPRGGLR
jgi:hypothetical protein